MRVNVSDPGYTATDFNRHSGHQTVTEGTDATVALATLGRGRADRGVPQPLRPHRLLMPGAVPAAGRTGQRSRLRSSSRTRDSISSRIGRTCSRGSPAGSVSSQSS